MSETVGEAMNAERAWATMTDEQRLALEESMSGPETLSQALARAQRQRDDKLRDRARHYLAHGGQLRQRRTLLGKSDGAKACSRCADSPRYPDYRCATHTAYLPEDPLVARRIDNDDAAWLTCWGAFFDRVASVLRI